jgi:hypothetical protein
MRYTFNFSLFFLLLLLSKASSVSSQQWKLEQADSFEVVDSSGVLRVEALTMEPNDLQRTWSSAGDTLYWQFEFEGQPVDLVLYKRDLLADNFRVMHGTKDSPREFPYRKGLHYQGRDRNKKHSKVAVSFFEDNIIGVMAEAGGNIEMSFGSGKERGVKDTLFLYRETREKPQGTPGCELLEVPTQGFGYKKLKGIGSRSEDICFGSYLEGDHYLFLEKGGVQPSADFITGFYNVVATLFDNGGIVTYIEEIFIWSTPDPYPTNSSFDALMAFSSAMEGGFNGDLAHLISRGPNNNGGIAWLNTVCSTNPYFKTAYSRIFSTFQLFPNYSWTVSVVAHELGHNLGSPHTHACAWNGNDTAIDGCGPQAGYSEGCTGPIPDEGSIMSYCHLIGGVGISFTEGFGVQPSNLMASILDGCSNCQDDPCSNFAVTLAVLSTTCGLNNGSAEANASGGGGGYGYVWSNGQTTQSVQNLAPGPYSVTVSSAGGCEWIESFSIEDSEELELEILWEDTSCGLNNGTATAQAFGGGSNYGFQWSNGSFGPSLTGLAAGFYAVTVTSNQGCIATGGVEILDSDPLSVSLEVEHTTCGLDDGVLVANAFGADTYTYLWNTGANTSSIQGLSAGVYTVTVTGNNGCIGIGSAEILGSSAVEVDISIVSTTCGENNGSLNALASGGSGYSYAWSNGSTNPLIEDLAPGIYFITVTASNGCQAFGSGEVEDSSPIAVEIEVIPTSCGDNNGQLTAIPTGGTSYTFSWSNGSNAQTLIDLAPGTYGLTVASESGCIAEGQAILEASQGVMVEVVGEDTSCGLNNGSATAFPSGGSNHTYFWSNGSMESTATLLAPGFYAVTVTSLEGCFGIGGIDIQASESLEVDLGVVGTTCGQDNGSATVEVNGGLFVEYLWSTGETGNAVEGLSPGVYGVTVVADATCVEELNFTIEPSEALTLDLLLGPTTCGLNNGTAGVQVPAQIEIGSYLWSNGSTQSNLDNLAPGEISVTVFSTEGCQAEGTGFVEASQALDLVVQGTDETCFACNDGTAQALPSGGSGYSYLWSNGSTESSIESLAPGTYSVTVVDALGCVATGSTVIEAFGCESFTAEFTASPASCPLVCDGALVVQLSGGETPYAYLWSNGETTPSLQDLCAGTYGLTIADANLCQATWQVEVGAGDLFAVALEVLSTTCGQDNGSALVLEPTGEDMVIEWSTGETGIGISDLSPGVYSVTISQPSGCFAVENFTIDSSLALQVTYAVEHSSCGEPNGSIALEIQGGLSPYVVVWSTGDSTALLPSLSGGTYAVTVEDSSGCSQSLLIEVEDSEGIEVQVIKTHQTCEGCEDGTAILLAQGAESYTYLWNNGFTGSEQQNLAPGSYSVTVTGDNGCSAVVTFVIEEFGCGDLVLEALVVNPICYDGLGLIVPVLQGGQAPYQYLWSEGSTSDSLRVRAGTYSLTLTDANGCVLEGSWTLTEPDFLQIIIAVQSETCLGDCNGTVSASIQGGLGPYSLLWDTGDTLANLEGLCPGRYTLTVTDSLGCQSTIARDVLEGNRVQPVVTGDTLICYGETGLWRVEGDFDSYLWSTGSTGDSLVWSTTDVYFVTATDDKGCTGTAAVQGVVNSELWVFIDSNEEGLEAVVSGGSAPYGFLWNTGDTLGQIQVPGPGQYSVTVTDAVGCTAFAQKDFQVSLNHNKALAWRIYPNPVTESLWVELPEGMGAAFYRIVDREGRVLTSTQSLEKGAIDLRGLPGGTYLLELQVGQDRWVKKFIKP